MIRAIWSKSSNAPKTYYTFQSVFCFRACYFVAISEADITSTHVYCNENIHVYYHLLAGNEVFLLLLFLYNLCALYTILTILYH